MRAHSSLTRIYMNKQQYSRVSQEAKSIYDRFLKMEGSEQIATAVNISHIIEICNNISPRRVLEMGGIGTLSYTILTYSHAQLDIYEVNEFCINALIKNLAEFEGRYTILNSYRILPPSREYDLMIVDGGRGKAHDRGFAEAPFLFLRYIQSVRMIFVEGMRTVQLSWVYKGLCNKYIYDVVKIINTETKGGTQIDCKSSNSRLLKFFNYYYWKIRDKHILMKAFKYQIKSIKQMVGFS